MYNIFGIHGRRKVNVPNLSGRTRSQAQSDLNSVGLNYSETSTNTSDSGLSNLIQSQGTTAGTVALIGDTVPFVYYNYVAPRDPPSQAPTVSTMSFIGFFGRRAAITSCSSRLREPSSQPS